MPILEDGQLFERYRVHRWLGSGIAGESYEAEDRILQRKVTLKLIHPWATLPDSARRQFFREMQGISLLNHPHLATVLDYGETDGRIYVARRYVSSGSLLGTNGRTWFHPPLPLADAFEYAHQLALALQYIHQHGYLHGALTFANVLVLRGPNTENDANYAPFLLADVGLANFVRRFGHPRIETLPVSAAPEQLNKRVTPASDQFALAVLLYFWLAGRPPYLGTSSEVEHQKLSEKITPLSILNPGVTLEQDELILRALTTYPEDRHASVLTFAEALLASLASANRHYALPTSSPAPQTETPLADLQEAQNAAPIQTTGIEAQAEATNHAHATTAATPTEQPTPPAQLKTEPYRSALEQLLAVPYETDQANSAEEASSLPIEGEEIEEDESVDEEENILLPTLPETPRLEEITIQTEFALIVSEEQVEPQANKQTGPLMSEPALDILYSEVNDFMIEMPLDLPDSTDSPVLDEFPPAREEISSSARPDEPLTTTTEEEQSVPQEELAASNGTSAAFPVPAEPAAPDDVVAPTLLPDAPAFPLTLPDEFLSSSEDATSTLLSEEPLPATAETISTDLPETPLLAAQETAPAIPAEEPLPATAEIAPVILPDEPLPATAETAPVILPDEPLPATAETAPVIPPGEITAADESGTMLSLSLLPAEKPAPSQREIIGTDEEETRILAELVEEQAEQPSTGIETTPVEPLEPTAEAAASASLPLPNEPAPSAEEHEHFPSSDKPVSPDEESSIAAPQPDISLENAGMHIPAEPMKEVSADNSASALAFEAEIALQPFDSLPLQETQETINATYPPIDEALVAPRLIISSPYTSSSYEFLLIGEETNIGRAGASDLYLEQDNLTSRHHALLKRVGERVLIFDKRSHNGVFINGQKIEVGRGYELADGDHIGIGNYELIFRSASANHVSQLI
jgi:hypothetical protein